MTAVGPFIGDKVRRAEGRSDGEDDGDADGTTCAPMIPNTKSSAIPITVAKMVLLPAPARTPSVVGGCVGAL
eukprot:gene47795-21295_t